MIKYQATPTLERDDMTNTYRTRGSLTHPVNDFQAARTYLTEDDMTQFIKYCDESLVEVVHHIQWDLLDEGRWIVRVITNRLLTEAESAKLSEWISGQNSDGLGEGFEQQEFAEHCERDSYGDWDDSTYQMSSFDWETNKCLLELVK